MDFEIITSSRSSQTIAPLRSIRVLVVDNDSTSLTVAAATLKSCKYEVLTAKDAFDALCTLRMKAVSIHLVLTEVHMPGMNGFELQKQIQEEFKLPVVFMSADDDDAIAQNGVQSGAALFIVKPITPSHLNLLWQFAVARTKGKTVTVESGSAQEAHQIAKAGNQAIRFQETAQVPEFSIQEMEHASSPIECMPSMKDSRKKAIVMDTNAEEGDGNNSFAGPRRPRFTWTTEVHRQFREAVKTLGGPKEASPKELVKLMNVPELTREQVANHLQKYRSSLRQVSESSTQAQPISERSKIEKSDRSTFVRMQHVPLSRHQLQSQNLEQGNKIPSLQHSYSEGYVPVEAPRLGDDPPYQNNLLLAGNTSASLFSGTNFTQIGQQKEYISTASGGIDSGDNNYIELTAAEASTHLNFNSGPMNEMQDESISPLPTLSVNFSDGHLGQVVSSSIECGEEGFYLSFLDEIGTEVNPFQQPADGEAHSLSYEHFLPSNQSPRQIN